MQHGGRYEPYLRKTIVTHIIATSLPDSKMRSLHDFKVVKPEWITDRYWSAEDISVVKLDRSVHFNFFIEGYMFTEDISAMKMEWFIDQYVFAEDIGVRLEWIIDGYVFAEDFNIMGLDWITDRYLFAVDFKVVKLN